MEICMKGGQRERQWDRDSERSSTCWLSSHMAVTARDGPGESQELRTFSRSPAWVVRTMHLDHLHQFLRHNSTELDWQWDSWDSNQCQYGLLLSQEVS